jgi:tetratricopeptide (TPR) repeat protein
VLKADASAAPPAIERALAQARELAQPDLLSQALSMGSIAANLAGDRASALRLLDESVAMTKPLDDFPARMSLLQARPLNGFFEGHIEAIKAAASEGVRLSRQAGDLYSLEMMLLNSGGPALISGDLEQAKRFYLEALKIAQRIDDRVAQYALLYGLGLRSSWFRSRTTRRPVAWGGGNDPNSGRGESHPVPGSTKRASRTPTNPSARQRCRAMVSRQNSGPFRDL